MNKHNGVNKKKAFRKSWSRDQVSLNTKTMRFGKITMTGIKRAHKS